MNSDLRTSGFYTSLCDMEGLKKNSLHSLTTTITFTYNQNFVFYFFLISDTIVHFFPLISANQYKMLYKLG